MCSGTNEINIKNILYKINTVYGAITTVQALLTFVDIYIIIVEFLLTPHRTTSAFCRSHFLKM